LSEVSEQRRLRINVNDAFPDVSAALYDTEFRGDAVWRQRLLQVLARQAVASSCVAPGNLRCRS
jgi:hypothetical protein